MRHTVLSWAVAVAAAVLAAPAQAVVLDFSGSICDSSPTGGSSGGIACTAGARINQLYGDGPGVDVTYNDGTGNSMQFWASGFSNLTNVASGFNTASTPHIDIRAVGGSTITLNSLDLGAWSGNRSTTLQVLDLASNTAVYTQGPVVVSGTTAWNVSFSSLSSATGFQVRFTDGFNIGIDNVSFTVSSTPTPVPEPSAVVLALAGLLGIGLAHRRRVRSGAPRLG